MAKLLTDESTVAVTLDLRIERILKALIKVALIDVQTPNGMDVVCALERAEAKPPAVVCAAVRQREFLDQTGLWEVACAVSVRLPLSQTGNGDRIFFAIEDALSHAAIEAALNTDDVATATGGVWFDDELARELAEQDEERVLAFRAVSGLLDAMSDTLGIGGGDMLGIGGSDTLGIGA